MSAVAGSEEGLRSRQPGLAALVLSALWRSWHVRIPLPAQGRGGGGREGEGRGGEGEEQEEREYTFYTVHSCCSIVSTCNLPFL